MDHTSRHLWGIGYGWENALAVVYRSLERKKGGSASLEAKEEKKSGPGEEGRERIARAIGRRDEQRCSEN